MVSKYRKGARAERELIKWFSEQGFEVIRAAGSGGNSLSPDILVFRKGKQYALECKAWDTTSLSLKPDQINGLKKWEEITGITTMVAWRVSRKGWRFIPLHLLNKTPKGYSVSWKIAENTMLFENLIR
ncbi:hypothetical protein KO317_01445 [Candidatus Micrarchaeota archaeon]|nr:hypothetical protein [Candidatus Micrarchaeota archaeon]